MGRAENKQDIGGSRRRHARTPLQVLVQYRFESMEAFLSEYSLNISPGGIFIKTLEPRKAEATIAGLIRTAESAVTKADALEARLHNPTAEVVYDILAMRGGTRLYSRLAPLQMWAIEADGPPTAGMTQVIEQQEQELGQLDRETRAFLSQEVAPINATADKLGLAFVIVGRER